MAQNTALSKAHLNLNAHDWTLNEVYAVRIFFDLKDDLDKVLPAESEPTQGGMLHTQFSISKLI